LYANFVSRKTLVVMTTLSAVPKHEIKPAKPLCDARRSPDGKWRSFPKVPNLVQYISTGTYFGRVKVDGKIFRKSPETDVFTTAKLRLPDFIQKKHKLAGRPVLGTFAAARVLYENELTADHSIKETAKIYRRKCIVALMRSWPELDAITPAKITKQECKAWASKFAAAYSPSVFNNTLSTLAAHRAAHMIHCLQDDLTTIA
jgi:hypothetical protein